MAENPSPMLKGPEPRLTPGYYAVSATVLYGLPWRFYDPAPPDTVPAAWAMAWNAYQIRTHSSIFANSRRSNGSGTRFMSINSAPRTSTRVNAELELGRSDSDHGRQT